MMYARKELVDITCVLRINVNVALLDGVYSCDGNASSDFTRFYLRDEWQGKLDFDTIFMDDWRVPGNQYKFWNQKRQKCAEILIPDRVPPEYIIGAYVGNEIAFKGLLEQGFRLDICENKHIFFLQELTSSVLIMIKVLIGDIFKSEAYTLVNTVNCVGVMGKGIALEFKKRFPEMFKDYCMKCKMNMIQPGTLYFYQDMFGKSVINFPTKKHWRSPSKLEDVVSGLDYFISAYKEWGIRSVAFPPLGCGNGGLDWKIVGPLMYQKLSPLDIDIEIYAPFGTCQKELKEEFLSSQSTVEKGRGVMAQKLKPEWIVLLETIYRLNKQVHLLPIGRTVFQKICYVLTEQGIDTGFTFSQGNYGPFSAEVKNAISAFANANLITEQQLGKMTAIKIGSEYERKKEQYSEIIDKYDKKIEKTVDLFCRIKNTAQAEEVTTVFYCIQQLKTTRNIVSEDDLYKYILSWKPHWDTEEKKFAIASAIRNLAVLRWISVEFSSSLPIQEEVY